MNTDENSGGVQNRPSSFHIYELSRLHKVVPQNCLCSVVSLDYRHVGRLNSVYHLRE